MQYQKNKLDDFVTDFMPRLEQLGGCRRLSRAIYFDQEQCGGRAESV